MVKYLDSTGLSTLWERIQTLANINGIEYIVGTQDEATNAWEGTSKDKACGNGTLYTGKVIVYHLPVAGTSTAATLNLTLPDGTTTGAKDVHRLASSTVTTTFAAGCDIFMVYDGTKWKVSAYVDSNTNTIGYQLRSNSYSKAMTDITYRYRLLFSSADNSKWVPANTSSSTNATASRNVCQTPINPFGEIVYYGTTASVAADSRPSASYLWQQYTVTLGYSFNRTGAALTLTSWKPVYVKCAPQANGSAIIDATTPYVQDLPTTDDGKIYIFLGVAYSATSIELLMNHPVFYYKDGAIRQWNNAAETDFVVDFVYDENEEDYVCSKTYSEITAALAANRKVVGVAKYNNTIQGIYSNVYTTGNSIYFVQLDEGEGSSPEIYSFILSNADELTTSTHRLLRDTDSVIRGANNIWCSITIGSNDAVTVSNNPFTDFDSYIFGNEQSVILKASVTYNSASYSHDVLIHAKYTGTGAANRKYIGITPLEYTNNKYLYLEFTNTTASGKVVEFYSKPSTGIPSTDLASAVQTSLGKADTALQPDVANDLAQGSITSSTGQGFDFIVDSDDNVLQDVLDAKASDNAVVHKTGTEAIGGNKTFDGLIIGGGDSDGFNFIQDSDDNTLQDALDAKANDSAVVHKTGNETIAGNKTFSGNAIFSDLDNVLIGNTSIGEIMEDTYAAKDEMAVTVSGNNTTITLNENLSTTVLNDIPDNIAYTEADSGEGEAYTGGYQLPAVTSEDNGKILSVSGGSWAKTENPSYTKTETYTKTEVNNLITSPESDVVIGALPASGVANTIYRVPSTNSYSDYGWDGTQFVLLATYDNAIDDVPTQNSDNLVKSGGVWESFNNLTTELNEVMPRDVGWSDLTSLAELRLGSYSGKNYGVGGTTRLHCVSYLPEPYITNLSATKLRITVGSAYRYGRQLLSSTFPYSSGSISVGTAEIFNDSAWQQGTTEMDLTGYPTAVTFGFVVRRSDNGNISPSDDIGLVVELYGESGWVSIEDAIDAKVSPIEQTVEDLYGAPVEYSLPNIGSTLARGQFATIPNHHYTIKVTPWDITGVVSTGQWIIVFEDGNDVIDGSKSPEPIHEEYNFSPTQNVVKVSTRGVVGSVAKMEIIDNDAGVVNQLNNRVGVLENEVNSNGTYEYIGEKINLQQRTYNKESFLVTDSNDLTTIKATIVTAMGHSLVMQSCAVYGKYFVRAYQYGGIAIYDLETKTLVSNFMLPLATADLETLHASNVSFGVEFPSGNTTFPAFYVCETTGQRRCYVFNLTLSSATLLQTITFTGTWGTGNDYRDFIVDSQNRCLWIIGYYNYGAAGNYSIFKKVDLRAISSATITYNDADVQQSFDLHEITVIQGVFIWNDRMYLGDQRRYIVNIDLTQGKIVGYVDFSAFMGELEGLTTYDNSLLVDNSTVYKLTLF